MDDGTQAPVKVTRWLGWAVAGLLVAGAVSVGAVNQGNEDHDQRVVAAAGQGGIGVELPTTSTPPPTAPPSPPVIPPPPSTSSTVAVRPPVSTAAPTTQPPRATTPTTRPSVTATTVTPATTATTTAGGRAKVTIANEHTTHAFVITVNGHTFSLAPGQQAGPVDMALYPHGNDIIEATSVADPTCGMGDADNYFDAGGTYRLAIVVSPGTCGKSAMPGPQIKVTAG